ncbi:MAG: (d)CMP kinase [Bacilli bacterium]
MKNKYLQIAIDGPAAAGKSSVAKRVAKELNFIYIDTGAMYRAFTYAVLKAGLDPQNEEEACSLVGHVDIILSIDGTVTCNNEDVTHIIREFSVSSNVSYIASYPAIRKDLVVIQRKLASLGNCVMDGRDIGTYVLPKADVKIFQIADVNERANRRFLENQEKGIPCSFEDVLADLKKRDFIDSNRKFAPLKPADDSIILDTTCKSLEEVKEIIISIIKEHLGGNLNA